MRPAINAQGTIISHVPNLWLLQAQARMSMPEELSQKCCCYWPIVQPSRDKIIDEMPSFFLEKQKGIWSLLSLNASPPVKSEQFVLEWCFGCPMQCRQTAGMVFTSYVQMPKYTKLYYSSLAGIYGRASCSVPSQETTWYLLLQVLIQQST